MVDIRGAVHTQSTRRSPNKSERSTSTPQAPKWMVDLASYTDVFWRRHG